MFEKLIEQVVKETGQEPILIDAFDKSQNSSNTLLIWWYNLFTHQFESSKVTDIIKSHSDIVNDKKLSIDKNWVKGRLIKYNEFNFLIIFTHLFLHNPITEQHFEDIQNKVKVVTNINIDWVLDDWGFPIQENKKK